MGDYKTELESDYHVSILDKDSICNMETTWWHHVGVNSPIYLFIISKDSFPSRRTRGDQIWNFLVVFFLLFQDFITLKGDYGRLLEHYFDQTREENQAFKAEHVQSMERDLKGVADLVVANDGDKKALELLAQNVYSKLQPSLAKRIMKRLGWENREHIEAIKELHSGGFEVIIGTDVTYIPDAILLLFATAMELKSCDSNGGGDKEQALILCLIFRRVEENHPYFQLHLKLVLSWLINGQQEFHLIHLKAL
ncbi:hypothetical protein NC653_039527 [Populus alba x Populus x berolinensis]|uniref:Uncharacterized protein n=1 Tax=Populus alba x Populus x berolinensis TaxID=444605 RepID=A0AAD6LBL6_9ROSI|nr:hypothetical protein NC653_039527 [Populus alba x Populus x berolinensis]